MVIPRLLVILPVGLRAGCASRSPIKPVEVLDERTAVTFGALKQPIELLPSAQDAVLILRKRATFAYLGPVEWNRSGELRYGLWIHISPGNDRQPPRAIHASAAPALILAAGPLALSVMGTPKLVPQPYPPGASLGQTASFRLCPSSL